jgi:hypothetical protein
MPGKEKEGRGVAGEIRWLVAAIGIAMAAGACSQAPQPVKAAEPSAAEIAAQAAIADAAKTTAAANTGDAAAPGSPPAAPAPEPAPQSFPTQPSSQPAAPPAPSPPSQPPDGQPSPAQPSSPPSSASPTARPGLVIIDPGGEGDGEVDIVAAARAERERRASAPPASRVITNKDLVKSAEGKAGKQPAAKPQPAKAAPAKDSSRPALPDGGDEEYWRSRSRELRLEWKEAVDQVADLERDADLLRRRFYAESDPFVRDTRIKPDWDRVLDRIREVSDDAARRQEQLAAHLEEGRRAGALPGWLREGIDLEPTRREETESDRQEAVEPPLYPEPIGEPPAP